MPFTATELSTTIVPVVTQYVGGGIGGSTRAKITFNNSSLRNTWVKITVLANANTGLAANDVFYFGNVVGDTQGSNNGARYTVNASDTSGTRNNQSSVPNSVLVTNIYDFNKTGNVNSADTTAVRNNQQASGFVRTIVNAPPSFLGDDVPGFESHEEKEQSGLILNEDSPVIQPTLIGKWSTATERQSPFDEVNAEMLPNKAVAAGASASTSESIDDFFAKLGDRQWSPA